MEFPPTFVINLKERTDRLESIYSIFNPIWPVPIERIDAVRATPGWLGCLESHKKAIEIALQRNYPFVIVLEDDCKVTPESVTRFKTLLSYLEKRQTEWDVFVGGLSSIASIEIKQYSPPLFQARGSASHFCLYNRRSIKILHEILKHKVSEPIDIFFINNMRIWCTTPHIATQINSKSDISDGNSTRDLEKVFLDTQKELKESLPNLYDESFQVMEGFLSSQIQKNSILLNLSILGILIFFWKIVGQKRN